MQGRIRRWLRRLGALLGTSALLGSGVAIAVMVWPSDGEEAVVPSSPASTSDAGEPAPKSERPKLTPAERRSRRAAVATLTEQGYEPVSLADYDVKADLRVLIGTDSGARRAFFFAGRKFVGYDSDFASRRLRVLRSGKRSVTLAYRLYGPADRECCPKGATAEVRFRWDGATLAPSGAVPDASLRLR
jgi:LppP/LprE lipoprotein